MRKLFLFVLAATSLSATEFTGGAQIGPAFAFRDLQSHIDSTPGLNAAIFGQWDLFDGQAVRARLNRTFFSRNRTTELETGVTATGSFQGSIDSLQLDYLYHAGGRLAEGFYLGGGLGVGRANLKIRHFRITKPSEQANPGDPSQSTRRPVFSLLLGYQRDARWNLELSYQRIKTTFRNPFTPSDDSIFAAVCLNVGLTFGR